MLGLLLVGLGAAILINFIPESTPALEQGVALAKASPKVQQLLGNGIKNEWPPLGTTKSGAGWAFTEFTVHLSGSKGSGHLYGVANAVNGKWEFSGLTVSVDQKNQKVDLTPPPLPQNLPVVPKKKVYLVPIGLEPSEKLDWAPAYYRAKFAVDVQLLPAEQMPDGMEDSKRGQVDSDRLIERMRTEHVDLVVDPANILIGITSRDMFIPDFNWSFGENLRSDGRFVMISTSRLHPSGLSTSNPEWFRSRVQKILSKNIAVEYFDLPLSYDETSLVASGTRSGSDWDQESESIIGAAGRWRPSSNEGSDFEVAIYEISDKPPIWHLAQSRENPMETGTRIFDTDLNDGLFLYRKTDFFLGGTYPLGLTRVYNGLDPQMRPFGLGMNDSLDIFLAGEMGKYTELISEDGGSARFTANGQVEAKGAVYNGEYGGGLFSRATAYYQNKLWTVERRDGWHYWFPYLPNASGANVTILTSFADPAGRRYEMHRDSGGNLLSVTTPSGGWLHFERDSQHRVHLVTDSTGRKLSYDYDDPGHLVKVADSEGNQERYVYDEKSRLTKITNAKNDSIFENSFDASGNIIAQKMSDGRSFKYHYIPDPTGGGGKMVGDAIMDPNGLITSLDYRGSRFLQSLPHLPK